MRILQILPELNVGGVETGTVDFAKYLKAKGHDSIVISHGGPLVAELAKDKIRHYVLPVHRKSLWSMLKCVKAVRKIIIDEKIDIVHARSRVPAWIAYFASRPTPAQFITTCHGHYGTHWFSRVMGWAKIVIVPSEVIGRHMIESFKVPSENVRCIPRSVDLTKFNVARQEPAAKQALVISMVGRITPLKGHVYFLKAMAKVIRSNPFVKIWIIGDASAKKEAYKQELELLVYRLGLTDHVTFLGNRQDVPQLLAQTDVAVLASTVPEAFGRVVLEAQAAGAPVVATQVGGVVEIIDHEKTGLLVLPKDPDAMAQAVLRLVNDRKFAAELAVNARKKIEEKFTLDHMAGQTIKVYQELLESMHILVMKISSIGDVILATASFKALRKRFPLARIYCLVGRESQKVLQRCPYLDGIIVYDPKSSDKGFFGMLRFSRKLRRYKFDKIIDFQNNTKSHVLTFLSFPKESYGYRRGTFGFLLTHPVPKPNDQLPPVEHQFQVLQALDVPYRKEFLLELWPTDKDHKHAQMLLDSEWLGNTSHIVGMCLAASGNWPTKNWPIEYYAKLCDLLAADNIRVLVTGVEKDRDLAARLGKLTKTKPASFVGKTDIVQLAALIKRCKVFVSPDSAPMHVAAAMKVPFIAFFGPTASARHLPPAKDYVVLERGLNCQPCYSNTCRIKTHACLREITPEKVAGQIRETLARQE